MSAGLIKFLHFLKKDPPEGSRLSFGALLIRELFFWASCFLLLFFLPPSTSFWREAVRRTASYCVLWEPFRM